MVDLFTWQLNIEVMTPLFPDPTVSETYTVVKGLEKPQEKPMRKTPGKRGSRRDRKAARKMRIHPRAEMVEQRRRPRRAPRLLEVTPLKILPTKMARICQQHCGVLRRGPD